MSFILALLPLRNLLPSHSQCENTITFVTTQHPTMSSGGVVCPKLEELVLVVLFLIEEISIKSLVGIMAAKH